MDPGRQNIIKAGVPYGYYHTSGLTWNHLQRRRQLSHSNLEPALAHLPRYMPPLTPPQVGLTLVAFAERGQVPLPANENTAVQGSGLSEVLTR